MPVDPRANSTRDAPHCDIRRCSSPLVESFVAPIYSFRSEEYIPFLWYNVKRLVLRGADHVEVKYFLCDIRWHKQRPWQPRLPNIFYQLIDMVCAEGRVGYKDIIVRHGPSCNLLVKVFIPAKRVKLLCDKLIWAYRPRQKVSRTRCRHL